MKKIEINKKKIALLILCMVCIGYFLFLFRFYNIDYFVPDFRLYNSMAVTNRKTADGFSSLFIWMAALCSMMPKFMTFISLIMMSLAIFNIVLFYYEIFWENLQKFILMVALCMSCGAWYYFYGKIFYDVPFSVYNYSLCLLAFMRVYINRLDRNKAQSWWYILMFTSGLLLSWKPYNIVMLAGAGLLLLAYDDFRKEVLLSLMGIRRTSISIAIFIAGYITGNFNILLFPRETIEGIEAYKASCPFNYFMFDKFRIIWDHINDLPFSISVFSAVFLIFIGIVWPIIIKKIRYLWLSLFMFGAFALYISYFSPGYAWHGFGYGFYLITYMIFLVKETDWRVINSRAIRFVFILAILVQYVVNFGYYIPTQIRWGVITQKSIEILENKEADIYAHVSNLIQNFGDSTYMIDNAIKRYRPYYKSTLDLRPISVNQPYIVAENVVFVDPLQYMAYEEWNRLYTNKNYLEDSENCNYIIYIMPNIFKSMNDVANIHLYDEKQLITTIKEVDYTIYVYSNLQ